MTLLYPSFLWLLVPLALLLWKGSRKIIATVHILVLMLLVLSLAHPVEEQALQEASIEAKDIVIALDVSYSMQAQDLSPTRYDFAKETITALLKQNPSDNIMLIAFTTNPLLLSPPTTDHTLINVALQSLNPKFILTKGTSLEKLFTKLASMKLGHKNLILMTDGGEEDKLIELSALVNEADISLHILALGTTQGSTIQHSNGSLLKDKNGDLVISRINPLLKSLAASTGGTYLSTSSSPTSTAEKLSDVLDVQENEAQRVQKMQHNYSERYQTPLFLALLLFIMLHTRAVKVLFILFAFLGVQVQASLSDNYHLNLAYNSYKTKDFNATVSELKKIKTPSLQSQITLANTYYKQRDFKRAIKIYKSIRSSSVNIKQQLYYNIANAYAMLGTYSKAKIYYTKTLQLGVDKDAEYNLQRIALLSDKDAANLGIAHPKSQDGASSKSVSGTEEKEKTREENAPSSGSGGGGESSAKKNQKKNKLLYDESAEQQPLGSKVYELINKGYIRETQPW